MRISRMIDVILLTAVFLAGLGRYELRAQITITPCGDIPIELVGDVTYNDVTKELKCKFAAFEIVVESEQRYDSLTCYGVPRGWIHAATDTDVAQDLTLVQCANKACDKYLVRIEGSFRLDQTGGITKCKNTGKALRFTNTKSEEFVGNKLTCTATGNWMIDGRDTGIASTAKVPVDSCDVDSICDEEKITVTGTARVRAEYLSATVSCGENELIVNDLLQVYESLACDNMGWYGDDDKTVVDATASFGVSCVAAACHKYFLNGIYDPEVDKNTLNTLKCVNSGKEIKLQNPDDSLYYYSQEFVCDVKKGWKPTYDPDKVLMESNTVLKEVSCVAKSCDISHLDANLFTFSPEGDRVTIKCPDPAQKLQLDQKTLYDRLVCQKEDGWLKYDMVLAEEVPIGKMAIEPVSLRCVEKECHSQWATLGNGVDRQNNELSCKDPNMTLLIEGTSIYAKKLTCNVNTGWTEDNINVIKTATEFLSVVCIGEACDKVNVDHNPQVKILEKSEQFQNLHAVCINENEELYVNRTFYKSVQCDKSVGWTVQSMKGANIHIKGARERIEIDCKIKRCDLNFIIGDSNTFYFEVLPKESTENEEKEIERMNRKILACKDPKHRLRMNGVYQSDRMACNVAENVWEANRIPGDETVKVECIDACKVSSNTKNVAYTINGDYIELFCIPTEETKPRLIIYKDEQYASLTCSLDEGWIGNGKRLLPAHNAPELTCKEYCLHSYQGNPLKTVLEKRAGEYERQIQFESDRLAIQFTKQWTYMRPAKVLTCSYSEGWKADGVKIHGSDVYKPPIFKRFEICPFKKLSQTMKFVQSKLSCKDTLYTHYILTVNKVPSPPLKCDLDRGWYDPKYPQVKRYHHDWAIEFEADCVDSPAAETCNNFKSDTLSSEVKPPTGKAGVYSCKNKKVSGKKNAIKINEKFVHSDLNCDTGRGWFDIEGNWLAGATDKVKIECEDSPCSTQRSKTICPITNFTDSSYECIVHDFDIDADPNMRKCGKNQKLLFKVYGRNRTGSIILLRSHFYDKLRCDDNGFLYETKSKRAIAQKRNPDVYCVQMRCNKCVKPVYLASTAPNPTTESIFTEGTSDSCAKAECPNGLWRVEIGGNKEEYYGEVVCSQQEATDSKWILDDGKEVQKAGCIEKMKSCKITGIESSCASLTDCTSLNLDSPEPIKCPAGKSMLYKQKDGKYHEEGKNIHCDLEKGWIIENKNKEKIKLDKSASVVCGQITTTTTTTTVASTTFYHKACDLCPSIDSVLESCDECSRKATDIDIESSTDFNKCFAKSRISASLQTAKQGIIKDKLECTRENPVWLYNGKEVGKFAAAVKSAESVSQAQTTTIVVCSLFAVIVLVVAGVLIYKWFIAKRPAVENSDDPRNRPSEYINSKRSEKLKEVSVDVPMEARS